MSSSKWETSHLGSATMLSGGLSARNRGSTRSLVDALPNTCKGYVIWGKHKPASNLLLKTSKGITHKPQNCRGTSSTKSQCHTPQQRQENAFLHWEFSNKWFPERHSACFPAHTWHLLIKQATGRKGLSLGPYLEAEKFINLAAGPSLSRVQ